MKRIRTMFPHSWILKLAAIAVAASLCRLFSWEMLLQSWAEGGIPISDARALDMWAVNILDGLGFRDLGGFWIYEAFRMPFFSVVVAAIYAVFGYHYLPVRLILCGLSVATCLGVAGIGRLLFNRKVGFWAGMLYALYYPMMSYAIAYMTETLFTFLFVIGVYMFLRALHERGWGFLIWSGAAFGLAGMTRFVVFVTVPVMLWYLLSCAWAWKKRLLFAFLWLAVMGLSFSPWVIRNALVFQAFFPTESGGTRQMWTAANPQYHGSHYSRDARRIILWADPEATEIERNQRLQKETRQFIRDHPIWYLERTVWRLRRYLLTPTWRELTRQETLYEYWNVGSTWMTALFGYLGFLLAIGKRQRSGLLLAGMFFSLAALHSLAGELPRYRLTGEWLWILGMAYTLLWLGRLLTHSLLQLDEERESGISASCFDRHSIRWGVPAIILAPFLVLCFQIPLHRAELRHHQLPELPYPATAMIRQAGLEEAFARQNNTVHDISYYIELAKAQTAPDIEYPGDVIVYVGELSHVIRRPDGSVSSCSFKVNKANLHLGDLVAYAEAAPQVSLFVPEEIKRATGALVGRISGTGGGAGEPIFRISDLYLYRNGTWKHAQ